MKNNNTGKNNDRAQQIKDEIYQSYIDEYVDLIESKNIYYVAGNDNYVRYDDNTRHWIHYKNNTGLFTYYDINGKEQVQAFKDALEITGHKKEIAVNTFKRVQNHALNFVSTDHWLKPIKGDVHPAFDLALKALSGENKKAQEKIEHTIAYKFLRPDDYKIPVFAINGEGGVLKNEFLTGTLGVLFGDEQVISTSASDALEGFNGEMLGKTVVLFDESKIDKMNYEKLKTLIGNEKMKINVKFGLAGSFDNTPLYFIASNEVTGAVRVGGTSVDRRFSIVTVKHNIMEICSSVWGTAYKRGDENFSQPTVKKWFDEFEPALRDKIEVAKWLYSIIEKYQDEGRPQAFHDEDYHKLLEVQKSPFDYTVEWIFDRPDFTHICDHDAYIVLQVMTKLKSPATGTRVISEAQFIALLDYWLERNKPEIKKGKSIKWKRIDGKYTNKTVYRSHDKTSVKDNTDEFIKQDLSGKWTLVDHFIDDDVSSDSLDDDF